MTINDLLPLILILAFTGAISGFLAGLLGIGGGLILVPVLLYSFKSFDIDVAVLMHCSLATSLGIMVATTLSSAQTHRKHGAVDFPLLKNWGPTIVVGVLFGAFFASHMETRPLMIFFSVVLMMVALYMNFWKHTWQLADTPPTGVKGGIISFVIGCLSAMVGIGGASFSVPTMVMHGFSIKRAVGTASAIGIIIAMTGTIGYIINGLGIPHRPLWSIGYVNIPAILVVAPMTIVCARFGARFTHQLPVPILRRIFALLLSVLAVKMFFELRFY